MESRRARKKQRTRSQIFEAAMQLFAQRGFTVVTIEQICRAADVARGTFFLHFPSKAALLLELDRQLAAELPDRLGEPRGSAAGEYRTLVDWLGERFRQNPGLLCQILATPGEGADAGSGPPRLRDCVEEIVRRGQRRGEFRENLSPRLAASLFLASEAEILAGRVFEAGQASAEEVRNQLLHVLFHGLRAPKPRLKWRPGMAEDRG
jgi:AcrR family transcriptional regulator